MPKIEIINPIDYPGWDDLVLSTRDYSFFHSSSWARVLSESYGYKPLYFTIFDNNRLLSLIPITEIKSFLTGKRGVSLPFSDYCEPIMQDESQFKDPLNYILNYGKQSGWKYIEWRGGENHFQDMTPSSSYYSHTLELSGNEQEILSSFRSSTKRSIKKAQKENVSVEICHSLESVKTFYSLNCLTRKHHGLPPQPFKFFKNFHDHIISKKKGFVVLASYQGENIAGAVYFLFGRKAIYKYGASDRKYQHLRANNLVMWEAIRWCSKNEFESFCFGRTEPENGGLLQFKRGWGAKEKILRYYQYDLAKNTFVKESRRGKTSYNFFKKLPSPLLNLAGSLLYKHVG